MGGLAMREDQIKYLEVRSIEMALVLGQPDAKERLKRKIELLKGAEERYEKLIAQKEAFVARNGPVREYQSPRHEHGMNPMDGMTRVNVSVEIDRIYSILDSVRKHLSSLKALEAAYWKRNLKMDEVFETHPGPTPESTLRPASRGSIETLVNRKRLEHHHLLAANEIAEIVEGLDTALSVKGMRLDAAGRPPKGLAPTGDRIAERISDWHHHRYMPWVRAMQRDRGQRLQFVLSVVMGASIDKARRIKPVIRYSRAVSTLRAGLDLYWKFKREDELRDAA